MSLERCAHRFDCCIPSCPCTCHAENLVSTPQEAEAQRCATCGHRAHAGACCEATFDKTIGALVYSCECPPPAQEIHAGCGLCNGDGWTIEVEHAPGCGQNGYECEGVQVQVMCPRCEGTGRVPDDPEKARQ